MATVTLTVKPSGGQYTTLAAAIAGLVASEHGSKPTLTTDNGSGVPGIVNIEIDGTWSSVDPTYTQILAADITSSASCYLNIYTTSAARHHGVWNTGAYILSASGSTPALYFTVPYLRIAGIQCYTAWAANETIYNNASGASDIRMSNSIIKSHNSRGYYAPNGDLLATLWNCMIYDDGTGTTGIHFYNASGSANKVYNCTIAGYANGVNKYGTTTLKNVLFYNCTQDVSNGPATDSYCATTNDNTKGLSAGGTGNRFSQTFTFVNAAGFDFHLQASDAGARGYGVSDPGAGLFSDDIDGDARG